MYPWWRIHVNNVIHMRRRRRRRGLLLLFRLLLSTSHYNVLLLFEPHRLKRKAKNNNNRINNWSLRTNLFLFSLYFFISRNKCIIFPMFGMPPHTRIFVLINLKNAHIHAHVRSTRWQIENDERLIVCRCFAGYFTGFGINIFVRIHIEHIPHEELFTFSSDYHYCIASFVYSCISFRQTYASYYSVVHLKNASLRVGTHVGLNRQVILVQNSIATSKHFLDKWLDTWTAFYRYQNWPLSVWAQLSCRKWQNFQAHSTISTFIIRATAMVAVTINP